jgi:HEAT repeat protein
MYHAPELPEPSLVLVFPEKALGLWLRALERPEADLRCQAAAAVALAQRRGVKGLEATIAPLVAALDRPDQHPSVRLAVAQALVALDARAAAPSLFRQAQAGGSDLRDLVEPALARWDYRPARAVWLERLRGPGGRYRELVLAIRSLGAVREEQAPEPLRRLVLAAETSGPVRLEAASALGQLRTAGLEKDAERLAAAAGPSAIGRRLAAAALLRRHRGDGAVQLLQRLAGDDEPAVAALAATRLLEIDAKLALPTVDRCLGSPDAAVRSLAVQVLHRLPTAKHLRLLGDRLGDLHPDVRGQARRALRDLAKRPELRDPIIAEGSRMLATRRWQPLEQATILLTQLDHKPAAERLVELLTHDRPEVFITAAWGLRKLAVPATLDQVVRHVASQYTRVVRAGAAPGKASVSLRHIDHELSQLHQLLGQLKHKEADGVLRRFIPRMEGPKQPIACPEARAGAIWALGLIHEGRPDAALVTALEGRLNERPPQTIPPEDQGVRRMAAISLGRLRAKAVLPSLRKDCPDLKPTADVVHNACAWAIAQLTGEVVPAPETIRTVRRDWFLTPND